MAPSLNCCKGSEEEAPNNGEQEAFINSAARNGVRISPRKDHVAGASVQEQSFLLPGDERVRISLDSKDRPENYEKHFSAFEDVQTLFDPVRKGLKESNNGKCLGWIAENQETYHWLSYKNVINRSLNFGRGLRHLGHKEKEFVGIYCDNRIEWVLAEQGLFSFSMVSVPLYDTLGPDACNFIITQAEVATVVIGSDKNLESLFKNFPSCIKTIIHVEDLKVELTKEAEKLGIKLHKFEKVEKIGKDRKSSYNEQPPKPEDIATLNYTSGTTGSPKGVILTHGNLIASASATFLSITKGGGLVLNSGEIIISYLPLAHIYERMVQTIGFMIGCSIGFYKGKVDTLMDAIQTLQPTILPCVPHVLNQIYKKSLATANESKWNRFILRKGMAQKTKQIQCGNFRRDTMWDKLVFEKIQNGLGGKIRLVLSGGAPINSQVLNFFRCALGCPVIEGYGQTETSGIAALTLPTQGSAGSGHVGPPLPCSAIKLMNVPELGYLAAKDIGEICVKGPNVFSGYYKDPIDTFQVFDMDGWMHTGDVGMWLPGGVLKVLHRRSHAYRLKDDKIIEPEKIEAIYSLSPYITQIFVFGEETEKFLVAIVVPSLEKLSLEYPNAQISALSVKSEVKEKIFDSMLNIARKYQLSLDEQVKDIYLHPTEFTIEQGLLTPTMKSKRSELKILFAQQIQKMYSANKFI